MSQALLDAGGRVPAPKNSRESAWARTVDSGALKLAMEKLYARRQLPLEQKIEMSIQRIEAYMPSLARRLRWGEEGQK